MESLLERPKLLAGLAGLSSYIVFLIASSTGIHGIFLFFFPLFPLFISAFLHGSGRIYLALAVAILMFATTANIKGITIYLLMIVPAAIVITYGYHRKVKSGDVEIWAPESLIISYLIVVLLMLVLFIALFFPDSKNLEAMMTSGHIKSLERIPLELQVQADQKRGVRIFIIPILMSAAWIAMSCFMAWLAHFTLASYHLTHRSSFTFRPSFCLRRIEMPIWFLPLTIVLAVASIFGTGELQFSSRIALGILILPYIYYGIAFIHESSQFWPLRPFILAFFYLLFLKLWFIIMVAILGIAIHLKQVLEILAHRKSLL